MAPALSADDLSLIDFAVALKANLEGPMKALMPAVFEGTSRPLFQAAHGRNPQSIADIEQALDQTPAYRWWGSLKRAQQEYYLDLTSVICDRQLDEMIAKFRTLRDGAPKGSLTLDPAVTLPPYQGEVDIHCVPGSYFLERTDDDVWAGARSDLGSFVYAMGKHGGFNEDKGVSGAKFIQDRFPDLLVTKVLDLGCTIGMSTLPYADAFPDAEIHALDLSAPSLRYGFARAESLGYGIHWRQGNAECTSYAAESFDLVVSHILLHETSVRALGNIFKEAHRLLKPGGVMLHVEVPVRRKSAFDQAMVNWDAKYNAEPFWSVLAELDVSAAAAAAGFAPGDVFEAVVPTQRHKAGDWLGLGARKAR